ncbi:MAG: M14 family zinc carboxypeptidase, partial [Candidatus Thorarchaeota archaeon]
MKKIRGFRFQITLLALMMSMFLIPAQGVAAQSTDLSGVLYRVPTPSVDRSWSDLTLIYEDQFHDPVMLQEEIDLIHTSVPELVSMEVIGQTYNGRNITSLCITNELNTEQKAKTLVVAQHHGREQISVETALRFILYLLNSYGVDETITEYVDTIEIYVIPGFNLDALDRVINEGDHWLRKNLRPFDDDGDGQFDEDSAEDVDGDGAIAGYDVYTKDGIDLTYEYTYYEGIDNDGDGQINEDPIGLVDLNRNYATYWGRAPGASPDPLDQTYHGTEAFSEPETQAFRDFAVDHVFGITYTLHSGINATWFATNSLGRWTEPSLYTSILGDFGEILPPSYNAPATATSVQKEYLETGSGLWDDWMYHARGSIVPITFELYRNASVVEEGFETVFEENSTHRIMEWKGIYGYFNPVAAYIQDLWLDVKPAFEYLLEMTPKIGLDIDPISFVAGDTDTITVSVVAASLDRRIGTVD